MIDAVLSFHVNPATCGVAKFNIALAQRLGVPCVPFHLARHYAYPLVSIKGAETPAWRAAKIKPPYDLFLHDEHVQSSLIVKANRVYAANASIADEIRLYRPDVTEVFCPSTVDGNVSRGKYRVLVFGMSHKLQLPHFERLKQHLDTAHPDYTVELSTAVHEGSPWAVALTESVDGMRAIFGDKLRVLGFLGDDALAKELRDVDAVAAYYTPALRANNTSAWAALEAGKTFYTNTDAYSPALDATAHSWDRLLEKMGIGVPV